METEKSRKKDPRAEELDRFWDIDALLPAKRPLPRSRNTDTEEIRLAPRSVSPDAVREEKIPMPGSGVHPRMERDPLMRSENVHTDEKDPAGRREERTIVHAVSGVQEEPVIHRYVYPHSAEELANAPKPEEEYLPESALIRRVRIFRWKSTYTYYENFAVTAEKFRERHGTPCECAPFFSYVPQYSQLNPKQLNWYFWLRERVRNGEYPDTDYSYLLLMIFEIINLAGKPDPASGQEQLCAIWANYRGRFGQLDGFLPEWICDYSLIHHLPPPGDLTADQREQIMAHCGLKEFFVGGDRENGYLRALLTFCTNYDYRKSKFCTEETAELFERSVEAALQLVTEYLSDSGKLFSGSGMDDCRVTREAFSAALCSHRIRRKIEVSYCSFSRSHELRFLITDVIKYTENKLRAHLGVRSRLTIYALPTAVRQLIDSYFATSMPAKKIKKKKKEPVRESYESLYDLPEQPISFANAARIEQTSWSTTQRLVEAFETQDLPAEKLPEPIPQMQKAEERATEESESTFPADLMPYRAFLTSVLAEDIAGQTEAAKICGKLPDAVADEINEIAANGMGDVLLEENGNGYVVIEEYRSLLEGLL